MTDVAQEIKAQSCKRSRSDQSLCFLLLFVFEERYLTSRRNVKVQLSKFPTRTVGSKIIPRQQLNNIIQSK